MADTRQLQLEAILQRRDKLKDNVQRIKGRLDSARQDVATCEAECLSRKIPPDKLGDAIIQLEERFDTKVAELTRKISIGEQAVKPYLEDAR